jgi:SOS-response transcriptional repressor LexA
MQQPSIQERRVFNELCDFYDRTGFMPSTRELAPLCGFASNGVITFYLQRLEARGWIKRYPGTSPRIRILRED